eukprot:NODE_275_length_10988_cov_0.409863.p5 type:complete len:285 gc:universal NODE_275_length_10988_cov_0.409863:8438-7584(-)
MENLKKDLIELGCPESHINNVIVELKKSKVSEDFNYSMLELIKGLKTAAASPEEVQQRMQTIQNETQGVKSSELIYDLLRNLTFNFSLMHQRNVKLMEELDAKEQEKEAWRRIAEKRGISLFKLITSVCISDILSKLPGHLQDYFINNIPEKIKKDSNLQGNQAEWDSIYTEQVLNAVIGAFGSNYDVDDSNLGHKSLVLLQVFESFCNSKSIPLEKSMLEGLKINKERDMDLHVKFTGNETDANDIIKACHIFGDYSSLLDKEQTALINDLWRIAKVLGVYNK